MKSEMKRSAERYLRKEELHHVAMLECICRGTADILYACDEGVLLRDTISDIIMMSAAKEIGNKMMNNLPVCTMMMVCQEYLIPEAQQRYHLSCGMRCLQAVYQKPSILDMSSPLCIELLDTSAFDVIAQHYDKVTDEELKKLLGMHHLYGGYLNGDLIGFIGTHLEGSMGLLEIFPEHRRRGYGQILETFMIQLLISKNRRPYAQIIEGNQASIELQKKIGLEILDKLVYWLY